MARRVEDGAVVKSSLEINNINHGALITCTKNMECGDLGISSKVSTVGLDDDRRTKEVLRDLGLKRNGPEDQNIIARAYENWTKEFVDIEDYGPTGSGPSRPPGFESRANGPTESTLDT